MCSRRKRGGDKQAIGRSRGGRTTKIHAVADRRGRLLTFDISPGQRGDVKAAPALIERLPAAEHLLADTAYDSDAFRRMLTERNTVAVIKPNPTRKREVSFDEGRYKARNTIERAFSHLKDWRRVATRYDKLARNFAAAVAIAVIIQWWA